MKQMAFIIVLVFSLLAQFSWEDIPQIISYQGLLTNASGAPVADGNYNLTFRLYNTELGVAALWTENHPSVAVIKGIFNVILGSGGSPLNLPFDEQYWLGVTIGAGAELTPRIKLTSTAYSLNAQSVSDGAITTIKLDDNAVTTAKIQPDVVSSVDGVSNDGGNIDLIAQNAVTIASNDSANTVTIGENHSSNTKNPHNVTAAQTGAPLSVDGVKNAGGDIDLVPGSNISIKSNDEENSITISASGVWKLAGNSGTSPGTHFLGTTDNKPLEFQVNGSRALRLEPNVDSPNLLGGYSDNWVASGVYGAFIGGGGKDGKLNRVTDSYGTVGGGANNQAGDDTGSTTSSNYATVGGGWSNTASQIYTTVGGGSNNIATANYATVSGGSGNYAIHGYTAIGGGSNNTASGFYATIPGGYSNDAQGKYSFAAGYNGVADHNGAFVWAGGNYPEPNFVSVADKEFAVRCAGGARFVTQYNSTTGAPTKWAYLNPSTAQWEVKTSSDRNLKDGFAPVDNLDILNRLAFMPVQTWNYSGEGMAIRHIGPTSQDFYGAFGMGKDDGAIGVLDAEGVALAAIKGLYEIVQEKETENRELKQEINDLKERMAKLEKLVSQEKE